MIIRAWVRIHNLDQPYEVTLDRVTADRWYRAGHDVVPLTGSSYEAISVRKSSALGELLNMHQPTLEELCAVGSSPSCGGDVIGAGAEIIGGNDDWPDATKNAEGGR